MSTNITGATFNFTKKVVGGGEESSTPEKPLDDDKGDTPRTPGDNKKDNGGKVAKNAVTAFAYDMLKTGVQQTVNAVMANASASPTLQVQLQAAQQVGGKLIAYTAAVATQNWAAVAIMAVADIASYATKQAQYGRDKAWTDYDIEQYRERRGYTALRSRK